MTKYCKNCLMYSETYHLHNTKRTNCYKEVENVDENTIADICFKPKKEIINFRGIELEVEEE